MLFFRVLSAQQPGEDKEERQEEKNGFWEKTAVQKSFFRKGCAGGWKGVLTDEQVGRIIDTHRVQMERFNYIPDGW